MTRVSAQGLAILQALTDDEYMRPGLLLQRVPRASRSLAVRKASLSRTLRRLWQLGLVELERSWLSERTATVERQEARHRLNEWDADPIASQQKRLATLAELGIETDESPERWREYLRAEAERCPRSFRVRRVRLTETGREWLTQQVRQS